jgi:diacylglycerol kinase (ATP)
MDGGLAVKTLVLVNPKARDGRLGERWPMLEPQLLGALSDGGETARAETRIEYTSAMDHGSGAVRRALAEGVTRVVVVGGDGTVSEAVQGFFEKGSEPPRLTESGAALAVMPAGRGDDFFKMLIGRRAKSSDEAWEQGLRLLRSGAARPADLASIRWLAGGTETPGRAFINIASFGFPGLVVKRVNDRAGPLGRTRAGGSGWAYLTQIVTGMAAYRPIRTEVKVDGRVVFDAPLFSGFVLNGSYNAGGMRWSDEARIDDGLLNVVLTEPRTPFATIRSGPRMLSGDWRGVEGIHLFEGRRVEVRTRETGKRGFPLFEVDGEQPEPAATDGALIEVMPGALNIWR